MGGVLRKARSIEDEGERAAFISSKFIDTPYGENTLMGGPSTQEVFTVNLEAVDCFTFIEYVEAMRPAKDFQGFIENLKKVRYRSGNVSYEDRNHFFTDWREYGLIRDVTAQVGGDFTLKAEKTLNEKGDGTCLLPGITPVKRTVDYIPSEAVGETVSGRLKAGDYAGIYSDVGGLDVSHVGVVVMTEGKIVFRHASSVAGKVVDEDFRIYLKGKPGLVILRAASDR